MKLFEMIVSIEQWKASLTLAILLIAIQSMHVSQANAHISFEDVNLDLHRFDQRAYKLNSNSTFTAENDTALTSDSVLTAAQPEVIEIGTHNIHNGLDSILTAEAVSRPPIYRSLPKQIEAPSADAGSFSQVGQAQSSLTIMSGTARHGNDLATQDLQTAAGHHKKKKKKKKIIIVKKKKKKMKKKKKKKKKKHMKKIIIKKKKKKKKHHKKKKIVVKKKKKHHKKKMIKKHSHQPLHYLSPHEGGDHDEDGDHAASHRHHHAPAENKIYHHHDVHDLRESLMPKGKYYEYRAVPKKGSWDFGFKRGNHKHHIERKEHGHKSHFKTIFNWKDKKGQGKHLFDYNHHKVKH